MSAESIEAMLTAALPYIAHVLVCDRDAGHHDLRLVELARQLHSSGYKPPDYKSFEALADQVVEAEVPDPPPGPKEADIPF